MKRSSHVIVFALAILALGAPKVVRAQDAASVDEAKAKVGKQLFIRRGCFGCHTINQGRLAGPDLGGLMFRREHDWVVNWLTNTSGMLASDPLAQQMLKEYRYIKMPNVKLTPDEIDALINYIQAETARTAKS